MNNKITRKWIEVILPDGWCYEIHRADLVIYTSSEPSYKMTIASLRKIDQKNMKKDDLMSYMPKLIDGHIKDLKCDRWTVMEFISGAGNGSSVVKWGLLGGPTLVLASMSKPVPNDLIKIFRKIVLNAIFPI